MIAECRNELTLLDDTVFQELGVSASESDSFFDSIFDEILAVEDEEDAGADHVRPDRVDLIGEHAQHADEQCEQVDLWSD